MSSVAPRGETGNLSFKLGSGGSSAATTDLVIVSDEPFRFNLLMVDALDAARGRFGPVGVTGSALFLPLPWAAENGTGCPFAFGGDFSDAIDFRVIELF